MRNSSLTWGVILLLLGGLMLGDAMGIRVNGIAPMSFFWPLALILFGGWMILGVMVRRQSVASESASVDLQGASEASVRLNHGAGELKISSGAGMSQLASGTFVGGLVQDSRLNGTRLEVRMSPPSQTFPMFGNFDRLDWDVRFNQEIPLALNLQTGADKADVDLRDLKVTSLKVETGASQTNITLPAHGRLRADFELGAASLRLNVPEGVSARIRVSQGVSDVKIDQARFPRSGDVYQSPDFDSAANAVEMKIEAGAAEIRVQ
jgi:hypothetical protein